MNAAAPIEVRAVVPADRERWDRFVDGRSEAEIGHRWVLHDAIGRVFGLRVIRYMAERAGECVAILPLVYQKSLMGRFLTSVPYVNYAGVLGDDAQARAALAQQALDLADRLRADRVELRGRRGADLPLPASGSKSSFALELPAESEALWKSLTSKVRAQVRRPKKEGYTARIATDAADRFYPLLQRRWHELGSPILPRRFFHELQQELGDAVDYALVERDGRPVAAGLLWTFHGRQEIPWAASAREHDRFGVNMLLYWRSLERAIERGCRWFDFGRSTPGSGHARFKLQWGASERPLEWRVRSRSGRGEAATAGTGRRELFATAWRKLPRSFASLVGPHLAGRIPY